MRAIQTRYAGCHFRSRLEARWAVFFDHLGIRWEYEPQGLDVGWRLDGSSLERFQYLPDFWLPEQELWFEVKGAFATWQDAWRFLNAAASIASDDGGGCRDNPGSRNVVIAGPMPRSGSSIHGWPMLLHMHKGDLQVSPWEPLRSGGRTCTRSELVVAADVGDELHGCQFKMTFPDGLIDVYTQDVHILERRPTPAERAALDAARSARFEHGQSGAT